MRILEQDQKIIESKFPEAAEFIRNAELRREYWDLCVYYREHPQRTANRTIQRINELRNHPACMEAWFVLQVGRACGQWPDGYAGE